ncbi:diaminobutyrate acetyltransferase [Anaerobacillus alkaliphilus]|uniref:L-2,4-diaminobutyric acid acetyltransferase n=1 Tax=Anaerobacillus alkaliphilus TaxID=1548597 RepID=A0A4Q0VTT1_9BACI|nr:diaminobutyrate acetyltransferase [Anaerobacillus alkaliphilus]RXJ00385.1 diaminobutyrate acetyltransferase [Anaerobacillus alkaliphilus]
MKSKQTMEQTIRIEKPKVTDGALMWNLVKQSTLDNNSPYKYIMMCDYFKETCVVVKQDEKLLGFITAFIPPEQQDVIFVWQVGVDPSQRGKGIASKMLAELIRRPACKNVRYLEATVTPSNQASQSLFRGLARKKHTECAVKTCYSAKLFPTNDHEEELLFRVGPLSD